VQRLLVGELRRALQALRRIDGDGADRPGGQQAARRAALLRDGFVYRMVMQHEAQDDEQVHGGGEVVPVVITTHDARAGDVRAAIKKIASLETTHGQPIVIRIVDLPDG